MPRDSVCKKCAQSIDPKELSAVCEGYCGDLFHAKCALLTEGDLGVLSWSIIWMCEVCINRFRSTRDSIGPDSPSETLHETSNRKVARKDEEETKPTIEDEVKELKKAVAGVIDTLAKIVPTVPAAFTSPLHSTPLSSSFMLLDGTSACNTCSGENETEQRRQSKTSGNFSLLLSNIDVSVSEMEIHQLVTRALGICIHDPDHVEVVKLISNWKHRSRIDYISFKVILDVRWKAKAMNPSTWPKPVRFREFVNRNNDTWKPV